MVQLEIHNVIMVYHLQKTYTFNQIRDKNNNILLGNSIEIYHIDTSMYIIHKNMIGNIKWQEDLYCSDGKFMTDIYKTGKYKHI